jgi:hypothetical protein
LKIGQNAERKRQNAKGKTEGLAAMTPEGRFGVSTFAFCALTFDLFLAFRKGGDFIKLPRIEPCH